MTTQELIEGIGQIRDLMISVATGGPRIQEVDDRYQKTYAKVSAALASRKIPNPITYGSLWDWYGRWSSGDLPSYHSRRTFVSALVSPLISRLQTGREDEYQVTGWERVDRTVGEVRERLASAESEEQFQAVGLLCRDALISLAQAVYDRSLHPPIDSVEPSDTDSNRMLEAYISAEMKGDANEELRRYTKASLRLANMLTHHRRADFRGAAVCVEATTATINTIAIIAGKRDPK